MNIQKIENDVIEYEIKDNLLYCQYKIKLIDLESAKKAVELRKTFTEGVGYPNVIRAFDVISMDKKARDYFSTAEATEGVLAGALISDSIFQATLANFFLQVTSPKIPTKLFTNENNAILWLKNYIAK